VSSEKSLLLFFNTSVFVKFSLMLEVCPCFLCSISYMVRMAIKFSVLTRTLMA